MAPDCSAVRVLDRVKTSLSSEADRQSPFLNLGTAARYLRGYHDEGKAARNMLATHSYRQLVHADDLGTAERTYRTVWRELDKRSMYLAALSDGAVPPSPVLILKKRGEAFDKHDFEEYRQAFFYTLECTAQLADRGLGRAGEEQQLGQWVIVMDMQGYSSKNSPPMSVSRETLRIFQHHFPERAKRIVILDAPFAFGCLWKMCRPLIDQVTRDKVSFVSRSEGEDEVRKAVGEGVWHAIEIELEEGKAASASLMVEAGLLRAQQ